MNRTPVKSSNIRSVGYDAAAKRLAVEFSSGTVYHYEDVPPEAHAALMSADSIGKHFGTAIRGKFHGIKQEAKANG